MKSDVSHLTRLWPSLAPFVAGRSTAVANSAGDDAQYVALLAQLDDVQRDGLCLAYEDDFRLLGYACDFSLLATDADAEE